MSYRRTTNTIESSMNTFLQATKKAEWARIVKHVLQNKPARKSRQYHRTNEPPSTSPTKSNASSEHLPQTKQLKVEDSSEGQRRKEYHLPSELQCKFWCLIQTSTASFSEEGVAGLPRNITINSVIAAP
jgi:hypothetical protein